MSASSPQNEDDLTSIGDLPVERERLTRIGEVPQVSDYDDLPTFSEDLEGVTIVSMPEDEPFPNLLPPEGKSPAEAEAEIPKELVASQVTMDRLRERLTSKPEPREEAPPFRFTMAEGMAIVTAFAVGLAVGRIDSSGLVSLLLGFGVTLVLIRLFFFGEVQRYWIIAAVGVISLYLGATLGTSALRLLTGSAS